MMKSNDILQAYRKKVNNLLSEYSFAKKQLRVERDELVKAKKQTKAALKTQHILQSLAQQVQEVAHQKIALIVTRCLQIIWQEEAYSFSFKFERKRGKTEATPMLTRGDNSIEDPMGAAGGSVCHVIDFALRI